MIITTDKKGLDDCLNEWFISVGNSEYFACSSGEELIGTFHLMPKDSIIKCKIQRRLTSDKADSSWSTKYLLLKRIGDYHSGTNSNNEFHGKLSILSADSANDKK